MDDHHHEIHYISSDLLTIERVGEILEKRKRLALSEDAKQRISHCREAEAGDRLPV